MKICIGVDLHKTQFTVYARSETGMVGKYLTTSEGYAKFLGQLETWRSEGHTIRLGVESTGNTRYFKSRMEQAGHEVVVINTLKFKVVNESVKKTDKHDAATIAEFLEKDMLPESRLCSETSEQLRRYLAVRKTLVRTIVSVKNQIHALLVSLGMEDCKASLQSKRGRQEVLATLEKAAFGLEVHPLFETIERLSEEVKRMEKHLEKLTMGDRVVELLQTIDGCGPITAWTIRAHTDDIKRFASYKKYSAYAGLAPWVQCSNETIHYGSITKRGPEELRTALVQLVLGMVRNQKTTASYRIMIRHRALKETKGTGKSIVATARKLSKVIWYMLTYNKPFDPSLMIDKRVEQKTEDMQTSLKQPA